MGTHRPFGAIRAPSGKETSARWTLSGNKDFFVHALCNTAYCCSPFNTRRGGWYAPVGGTAHCACHSFWFNRHTLGVNQNQLKMLLFLSCCISKLQRGGRIKRAQVIFGRVLLPEILGLQCVCPVVCCSCPRQSSCNRLFYQGPYCCAKQSSGRASYQWGCYGLPCLLPTLVRAAAGGKWHPWFDARTCCQDKQSNGHAGLVRAEKWLQRSSLQHAWSPSACLVQVNLAFPGSTVLSTLVPVTILSPVSLPEHLTVQSTQVTWIHGELGAASVDSGIFPWSFGWQCTCRRVIFTLV